MAQARALIRAQPGFDNSGALQRFLHEHEDFWWAPIVGKRVTLRRRGADDLSFVRRCWSDAEFMRKFNRVARQLPQDDDVLKEVLAREHVGLWSEAKALHWTLHAKDGPIGFISATDYTPGHRRCEFLIGLLGQGASPVPVEATHLACDFLRERAGVERLTAYFYKENAYASKVARKFGFEPEGVLRGYIRDADGGRSDLMVSGLLLGDLEMAAVKNRRRRLAA
ncbi:MAG: GNAT family N-acetyltransferase [Pseudomonadota bacterium]